jgi:hypothetical protein
MGNIRFATVFLALVTYILLNAAVIGCDSPDKLTKPTVTGGAGRESGANGPDGSTGDTGDAETSGRTGNAGGAGTSTGADGSAGKGAGQDGGITDGSACSGCVHRTSGSCYPGTDIEYCGTSGDICDTCTSDQSCIRGECTSETGDGGACSGCLGTTSGICYPGTDVYHCGTGGELCNTCTTGQWCANGECIGGTTDGGITDGGVCSGCVGTTSGICYPGTEVYHCGTGGELCNTCTNVQSCIHNQCQ